jgi:hypothetical protein
MRRSVRIADHRSEQPLFAGRILERVTAAGGTASAIARGAGRDRGAQTVTAQGFGRGATETPVATYLAERLREHALCIAAAPATLLKTD